MSIPTEPIGSIPRPAYLLEAMGQMSEGRIDDEALAEAMDRAVAETIRRLPQAQSHRRALPILRMLQGSRSLVVMSSPALIISPIAADVNCVANFGSGSTRDERQHRPDGPHL